MQTHFSGEVCNDGLAVCELYTKERVGKRLFGGSFCDFEISHICAGDDSKSLEKGQALVVQGGAQIGLFDHYAYLLGVGREGALPEGLYARLCRGNAGGNCR